MNRIIIIGNGFDLAHGLPTGYRDFVDSYWSEFAINIYNFGAFKFYEDDLVRFENGMGKSGIFSSLITPDAELNSYQNVSLLIEKFKKSSVNRRIELVFKNDFWKHISATPYIKTWLDIENEYYYLLKSHLKIKDRNNKVKKLNDDFCQVKNLLEKYLTDICEKKLSGIKPNLAIVEKLFIKNGIERRCVALSKQAKFSEYVPVQKEKLLKMANEFVETENEQSPQKQVQALLTRKPYVKNPLCEMSDKELDIECEQSIERQGIDPERTMVLNFNYTHTFEKLYATGGDFEIINIHGELNNPTNPLIFGYGDELDEDYKEIEKANDNDLLDNIKHVNYANTNNYRRFLEFLQLGSYQVFIMGHSCGNSDRTLLNTIFEHTNCTSIKPFYYQWEDKVAGVTKDNYTDIYKNISRNFNNKHNLRDIVVNKTYCDLMPQI